MTELAVAGIPSPQLQPPQGLQQILTTFGDINNYVQPDGSLEPEWWTDYLSQAQVPFPLVLSFDHSRSVTHFSCHKLMVGVFENVFSEIQSQGLQSQISSFGGCFSFRPQRTGSKLSAHSWGIAIDLNPETNAQGSAGNMSPGIVEIFRASGFEWGGDWPGRTRDPMHFQFCTGY